MSNTNTVIDMVAKEALRLAHEKATFLGTVNRDYDDSFAKSGAKIGSTLRVRNPNAYTRRTGSRVMNVQDTTETTQTITVATQDGVDLRWNSAELTLDIDELSRRYIDPAMSVLVSGMESDHLATATKAVYNVVGTAGTVVGASGDISALGQARAKLNQGLAPGGERNVQMDSVTMASVATGIKGLFLPKGEIERAWREGHIGQTQMATFYENERTWASTNGSDVTGTTDATGLEAAESDGGYVGLNIDATVAVAQQIVGQVFTIAGVYAVHPETKQAYGHLQQFVITAVGATVTTVAPKIYLSGPKQNVASAASAALTTTTFDSATLTFHGAASAVLRQNLMYHKDAFTFVTADLPLMDDAHKCVRMQKDGISLRVWQASDIRNDELLLRIDILHGFKVLRPEWASRISN
jgi:hypothetical protein